MHAWSAAASGALDASTAPRWNALGLKSRVGEKASFLAEAQIDDFYFLGRQGGEECVPSRPQGGEEEQEVSDLD